MNNVEVKLWARGIFESRYVKYMKYLKKDFHEKIMLKLNRFNFKWEIISVI